MVRIEDAIVVKYERDGHFEVLADPEMALAIKEGRSQDVRGALAAFEVFKDARKAEKASESEIERVFDTLDLEAVAGEIIRKGEFNPTTEQKRRMIREIRNRLIELVRQNSLDPRTKLPHTRERIEWAFENARVKVELRPAEEQLQQVVKELRKVLPLSFGTAKLEVHVPAQHAPSLYGKLHKLGNVLKEEWLGDGSLMLRIEVPSGMKVDVISELGELTKGDVMVKEV